MVITSQFVEWLAEPGGLEGHIIPLYFPAAIPRTKNFHFLNKKAVRHNFI